MWISLLIGFVCGYLMIGLTPTLEPFTLTAFFTELIFQPIKTFVALSCFLAGFVANASLIRAAIVYTVRVFKRKDVRARQLFLSYSVAVSFVLLAMIDVTKTVIFFLFSATYGMMSMDIYTEQE